MLSKESVSVQYVQSHKHEIQTGNGSQNTHDFQQVI